MSANLIIHSTQGSRSKEDEVKVGRGGARRADRGYIGNFLLSFIIIFFFFFFFFLSAKSKRRINQRCASVRNTSACADGARKTDATYSIN